MDTNETIVQATINAILSEPRTPKQQFDAAWSFLRHTFLVEDIRDCGDEYPDTYEHRYAEYDMCKFSADALKAAGLCWLESMNEDPLRHNENKYWWKMQFKRGEKK